MKIRFRYNGLFVMSCALFAMMLVQQKQIDRLKADLSKYAKIKDIKTRSEFVNYNVSEIAMHAMDAHNLAKAAYDMAYEKRSMDEWMVGLTIEEIDSIRLNLTEKPSVRF